MEKKRIAKEQDEQEQCDSEQSGKFPSPGTEEEEQSVQGGGGDEG